MSEFIGRREELEILNYALKKKAASFIVIKGRRRIGKSRLIQEFSKNKKTAFFTGIPPRKGTSASVQKATFVSQLAGQYKYPTPGLKTWLEIFEFLAQLANEKKTQIIVLDEISWIGSKDPDFLGYLKMAWDKHFSLMPQMILIVCGSVSSWIEKNILSNTGFVGRISTILQLKELPVNDCAKFWSSQKNRSSPYEIFKILSVTGGVPKYLEEVIETDSALENISRLCFKESGLLFSEFERIFNDLFYEKSPYYREILLNLAKKSLLLNDIYTHLGVRRSGHYISYVDDLVQAGFISRDYTWDIKTGKTSSLSRIRLSDNYIRFYLKVILPHQEDILKKSYNSLSLSASFHTVMGLQFENLVLNNMPLVCKHINLPIGDIKKVGPFFQRPNNIQRGCQIDVLVQTHDCTLYLIEVKFSKNPVGREVINEVQQKIDRLYRPKGFSIKPVLIHVNGVSETIYEDRFFSRILDFKELI